MRSFCYPTLTLLCGLFLSVSCSKEKASQRDTIDPGQPLAQNPIHDSSAENADAVASSPLQAAEELTRGSERSVMTTSTVTETQPTQGSSDAAAQNPSPEEGAMVGTTGATGSAATKEGTVATTASQTPAEPLTQANPLEGTCAAAGTAAHMATIASSTGVNVRAEASISSERVGGFDDAATVQTWGAVDGGDRMWTCVSGINPDAPEQTLAGWVDSKLLSRSTP